MKTTKTIKISFGVGLNWFQALRYKYSKKYKEKIDKFCEKEKKELESGLSKP